MNKWLTENFPVSTLPQFFLILIPLLLTNYFLIRYIIRAKRTQTTGQCHIAWGEHRCKSPHSHHIGNHMCKCGAKAPGDTRLWYSVL